MINGGLVKDGRRGERKSKTWEDGKNLVFSKDYKSLRNEGGFTELFKLTARYNVCGFIQGVDFIILFSVDMVTGKSRIDIYREGIGATKLLDTAYLDFDTRYPNEGVFQYDWKGNLNIAWWNGVNTNSDYPRLLTIDMSSTPAISTFPSGITSYELADPTEISLCKLFPNFSIPNMTHNYSVDNGGLIECGAYYFAIQYLFDDGTPTIWGFVYNPIICASEIDTTIQSGEITKTFNITFSGLDTKYKKFRLGVIKDNLNIVTAGIVGTYSVSGTSMTIDYIGQQEEAIDYNEILVNSITYSRVKTGTVLENRLVLGNVKEETDLGYQKYANAIKVNWDYEVLVSNYTVNDDSVYINRSFMPDEVYALYFHFILKDGTISNGYHIPGREMETIGADITDPRVFTDSGSLSVEGEYKLAPDGFWLTYNAGAGKQIEDFVNYFDAIAIGAKANFYIYDPDGGNYVLIDRSSEILSGATWSVNIPSGLSEPKFFLVGTNFKVSVFVDTTSINPIVGKKENDTISSLTLHGSNEDNYMVSGTKIFHTRDTAYVSTTSEKKMGYWENENEVYPNTDDWEVWDWSGGSLVKVGDLAGQKVRHHKMPSEKVIGVLTSNKIGIKLSNINIPASIKSKVQGYLISYAKRTFDNSTVLGTDIAKSNDFYEKNIKLGLVGYNLRTATNIRNNDLILLGNEYTVPLTYIKAGRIITHDLTIPSITNVNFNLCNDVQVISSFGYQPANNSGTTPSNVYRERCLNLDVNGGLFLDKQRFTDLYSQTSSGQNRASYFVTTMYSGNQNVYPNFNLQDLVYTGFIFKDIDYGFLPSQDTINIDTSVELQTLYPTTNGTLYGGDVMFNQCLYYVSDGTVSPSYRKMIQYLFTPENTKYRADVTNLATPPTNYEPNSYSIALHFQKLNNLKDYGVLYDETINAFPYRISRSVVQGTESKPMAWRTFLALDYYEMPKDKGEVWKLLSYGTTLMINQKYSSFIASIKDVLKNENLSAYLGVGDIFDRPPTEILSVPTGYVGCQSQWGNIVTKDGILLIDVDAKKIFLYTNQLNEISSEGLRDYLWDNMALATTTDNPFNFNGYISAYDEENERILITKRNTTDATSFTLSYYPKAKRWVSFHDYLPTAMFNTRHNLYFSLNNVDNSLTTPQISLMLYDETVKCRYFGQATSDTKGYDSYVDILINDYNDLNKVLEGLEWNTDKEDYTGLITNNTTIDKIMVFTDRQCSGFKDVNTSSVWYNKDNGRNIYDTWYYNDIRDLVVNDNQAFLTNGQPNANVSNTLKNWYKKSNIISKYFVVRLLYSNTITSGHQDTIYINDINLKFRKLDR